MKAGTQGILTTGQAAKLCAVTPDTVLKWIKKGKVPATRTAGGHYRIALPDLEPFLADDGRRRLASSGGPLSPGDATCELQGDPAPDVPCWEYLADSGAVREGCRRCIVYRAGARRCFLMAGLEAEVGHAHQFCEGTCEDCLYYRRVQSRQARVLFITGDDELASRSDRLVPSVVALRVARNGYEAASIVPELRPDIVLIDLEDVPSGMNLLDSLAADPHLPDVRVILVVPEGEVRHPLLRHRHRMVAAVLEKPDAFTRFSEVMDRILERGQHQAHRTA